MGPVIDDLAPAGSGAAFEVIYAHPLTSADYRVGVYSKPFEFANAPVGNFVLGQPADKSGLQAETGKADGNICLSSAEAHI